MKSQQYFLLHQDICHYIEIRSEIQISKLNNGFADKQTKRCFGEKFTVLDVIFKTTDHPPLERRRSAEQTFHANALLGTRWKQLINTQQTSGYTTV